MSNDRKNKFAYFCAVIMSLGYVASGFLEPLQGTFGLFIGGVAGIAGLMFAANVVQKATTKEVYLKELEMKKDQPEEESTLRGTF